MTSIDGESMMPSRDRLRPSPAITFSLK